MITINTRFISSFSAWKVIGVDVTKTGFVILECEKDTIASDDDMENEIADKDSIPVWTVSTGTESTLVKLGETVTLSPNLYKDGVEELGESYLWNFADRNIATVENGVLASENDSYTFAFDPNGATSCYIASLMSIPSDLRI